MIALSRVPFLEPGYGVNVDAWRVARVARSIAETGELRSLALSGLSSCRNSLAPGSGTADRSLLNGLSALMSLLACFGTWQVARHLRCRDTLLLISALAFTPVFYVSSVTAKTTSGPWLLPGWRCGWRSQSKPLLSGILLGFGVGCRITTGGMLLPLALILIGANRGPARWRAVSVLGIASVLTGAICFLPVWRRYGWGFVQFYESHGRPEATSILLRGTWEVWGALGLVGLVRLVRHRSFYHRHGLRPTSIPAPDNRMVMPALLCIILVYAGAFLRVPDQAGHPSPVVPATLLLLARFAPRRAFQICCALLIIAPFLDFSLKGLQAGAILADHRERQHTMSEVTRFVQFTEAELPGENLVVVGGWEPMIAVLSPLTLYGIIMHILPPATRCVRQSRPDGASRIPGPQSASLTTALTALDLATFGAQDLRQLLHAPRP